MVSIIVPIYNSEKKLARCIESIINQTYRDIEILLIDDGSQDSSSAICQSYTSKDNRVKYFLKKNEGAASSRNYGLSRAVGDFVQFVDSDDYIDPMMTELMVRRQESAGSDWVICGMRAFTEYNSTYSQYENVDVCVQEFYKYIIKYLSKAILHSCCNKLYVKNKIHSLMNSEYRWGEDFIFNIEYLKNVESITIVEDQLYHYDCSNESVTRSKYQPQNFYIVQRYKHAYEVLNALYASKEVDSLLSALFIKEILSDYSQSTSLLKFNKQSIQDLLSDKKDAIARIIPYDRVTKAVCARDFDKVLKILWKERFKSEIKAKCKFVIGVFNKHV